MFCWKFTFCKIFLRWLFYFFANLCNSSHQPLEAATPAPLCRDLERPHAPGARWGWGLGLGPEQVFAAALGGRALLATPERGQEPTPLLADCWSRAAAV